MLKESQDIYQYQPLWDKWQIDELIGSGSFGQVYRVSYQEYGHTYLSAVKMISIPGDKEYLQPKFMPRSDAETIRSNYHAMVQSLVNEVSILYSLSGNTNILGYHDHQIIEHQNRIGWDILIRMEYVQPLSKYLAAEPMTMADILTLGIDICSALNICSKHKIIHRDIKDENIFINDDGIFKLGDFGIAMQLLPKDGWRASMGGTPNFMAPEVYHGEKYGSAVDIYSLGLVLFRLLNHGRLPNMPPYPATILPGDSQVALEKRMSGEAFPAPDQADIRLSRIIMKACAYLPADRYASPMLMKRDLERALGRLSDAAKGEIVTRIES